MKNKNSLFLYRLILDENKFNSSYKIYKNIMTIFKIYS